MTITDSVLDTPQEPPGSAVPPGLGLGSDDEGPEDAFAMPTRATEGRPIWIYAVAAVGAIVVLVLAYNLLFGGDGDGASTDEGAQVSGQEATDVMCTHVQQIQVLRDDALAAAAEQLQEDAATLKEAGERRTAKQVRAVVAEIDGVRQALANQEDTVESMTALEGAIADLPC